MQYDDLLNTFNFKTNLWYFYRISFLEGDGWALPWYLQTLRPLLRPAWLLAECRHAGDHAAEGFVLAGTGQLTAAFAVWLEDLVSVSVPEPTLVTLASNAAKAFFDHWARMPASSSAPALAEALAMILTFWAKTNLPVAALEELLVAHRPMVAAAACACFSSPSPAYAAVVAAISASTVLDLYETVLSSPAPAASAAVATRGPKVTEERLWSEIMTHLAHGPLSRARVVMPAADASLAAVVSERVVFTCRHTWPRRAFVEAVIPEFARRLKVFLRFWLLRRGRPHILHACRPSRRPRP
jgi:hypothetical protein